jgi:hypothetical protein
MRQNLGEGHETAINTLTTALHTADKKTPIAHFILERTTFSSPIFFRKISTAQRQGVQIFYTEFH